MSRRRSMPEDPLALRAELLEARASLYDPGTGLPTLAVVTDKVGRMLDDHESVRVFLLRVEQEQDLELVVGWEEYDGIVRAAAGYLRELVLGLGDDRCVLALDRVWGDRFYLFLAGPPPGGQLLDALRGPVRLPGESAPGLEEVWLRVGQGTVRRLPAQRVERCVYRALEEAERDLSRRVEELDSERRRELAEIISGRAIRTLFQPIVRLPQRTVVGYEALSRGPAGSYLEPAEHLFGFAERARALAELERLCVERALANSHRLPLGSTLFLNISFMGLEHLEGDSGGLVQLVRDAGWSPREVVLEITERTYAEDPERVGRRILALRRQGFRFAIDDVGTGYSSLHVLADIQPDYIKLDRMLVSGLDQEPIKRNLVSAVTGFARSSQSLVIGEGVERAEEASVLQELGVHLLQGFYFGRPEEI